MAPIHLPKINPPSNATGEPNPRKGNTHKTINSITNQSLSRAW